MQSESPPCANPIRQIIQQTGLPAEQQFNILISFAVLKRHLTCNFTTFVQALTTSVPAGLQDLTTAMAVGDFTDEQRVTILSGFLQSQAVGANIAFSEFVAAGIQHYGCAPSTPKVIPITPPQVPVVPPQPLSADQVVAVLQPSAPVSGAPVPQDILATPLGEFSKPSPPVILPSVVPTGKEPAFRPGNRVAYNNGAITTLGVVAQLDHDGDASIKLDSGDLLNGIAPHYLELSAEPLTLKFGLRTEIATSVESILANKPSYDPSLVADELVDALVYLQTISPFDGSPAVMCLDLVRNSKHDIFSLWFHVDSSRGDQASSVLGEVYSTELLDDWVLTLNGVQYCLDLSAGNIPPFEPTVKPAKLTSTRRTGPGACVAPPQPVHNEDDEDLEDMMQDNDNVQGQSGDQKKKRVRRTKAQIAADQAAAAALGVSEKEYLRTHKSAAPE